MATETEYSNRRSVTLPNGWWTSIRGVVKYIQRYKNPKYTLADFWAEAAQNQMKLLQRRYFKGRPVKSMRGPLRVGRPREDDDGA